MKLQTAAATGARRPLLPQIERVIGWLNAVPYSVIILAARAATFSVFFRSFLLKISDWSAAEQLFANEYHVPILPPHVAAVLAATMECGLSTLVLIGLFARLGALGLLGMTTVIEVFVYPEAWPDHIQWLAFMVIILFRGPGQFSLDALLGQRLGVHPARPKTN